MHTELKPWVAKAKKIATYAIIVIAIVGIYVGLKHSSKNVAQSQKLDQISISSGFVEQLKTTDVHLALADFNNPVGTGISVKHEIMAWNAQLAWMYATGGVRTSKGSLFAKYGIDCEIIRAPEDDCGAMVKDFCENAAQLASGKTKTPMIVSFMGDGMPGFSVTSALGAIDKLGKGHRAIVFYAMGRSNGEDCFWGPADWKLHPEHCLGKCVLFVERDGDGNIVLKWASDNGIKINANTKVFDSFALNVIPCSNYNVDLCKKMTSHYTESRDVVSNGKTVPGLKHVCECDAFSTWTPADKNIIDQMGGFERLASTAEYTMQMPCVSVIDGWWADSHPNEMHNIILALGLAGDQVRSFPDAQEFACRVSAKVYGEKDANYWLKYYRGSEDLDKKGVKVRVGGSQVFNLADAAMLFGIGNEKTPIDRYKVTYEMFGGILTKLYPKDMEGMMPYEKLVDKSYLQWVLNNNDSLKNGKTEASTNEYASGTSVTEQYSEQKFDIKFSKGSAIIDKSSYAELNKVAKSAIISGKLTIFVYGHTDVTGDATSNLKLSKDRAKAVALYLHSQGVPMCENCQENRIQWDGFGSTKSVYGVDGTDVRNRCVEIIQGK